MREISVIIPAYNAEETLADAAGCILRGTFSDLELLIVDDGSGDKTLDLARRIARSDQRVRVQALEKNRGVGAARNAGLDLAEGRYIAFLDADDRVRPQYLEKLFACAKQQNLDWVVCAYQTGERLEGGGVRLRRADPVFPGDRIIRERADTELLDAVFFGPGKNNLFSNAMGIYRREAIEECGLRLREDISFGEDTLFNYEWAHRAHGFGYLAEPLYLYMRGHRKNGRQEKASRWKGRKDGMAARRRLLRELESLRQSFGDPRTRAMRIYSLLQIYGYLTHGG